MRFKTVLYIILVGLIIAGIGGGMAAYYDNKVNLLSQQIQTNYRDHTGIQSVPLLMADRDHFGTAEGESLVLMVLGLFIAGMAPLNYVVHRWRAGKLSLVLRQASVVMSVGLLLLTVGALTGASASIRRSEIDEEISIISARGPVTIQDTDNWVILYSLYVERDTISGRLPYFWGLFLIGLIASVLAGISARLEVGRLRAGRPDGV